MLDKKYDHLMVEKDKYETWKNNNYFKSGDLSKEPYCIVIPPPNVTGKLHLGHAWDTTIQDTLIRYKRMQGFDTLYLPGMDHAGIATQAKVEAKLREQGVTRYDLGRDKFVDEVWNWKDEFAKIIKRKIRKIFSILPAKSVISSVFTKKKLCACIRPTYYCSIIVSF